VIFIVIVTAVTGFGNATTTKMQDVSDAIVAAVGGAG
jgi:hypothetical protein